MDIPEHVSFYVGGWQVSPDEDTVSRDGHSERLEPLAMQVLVYLASRAGEVVSRTDLEQSVWRSVIVGYDAVTSTIIKLRKALGDNARNPTYIATVPKRGYQLIAPVSLESVEQQTSRALTQPAASRHASILPNRVRVALLVLALAIITTLAWALLTRLTPSAVESTTQQPTAPAGQLPSIVVLPFENLSDDPLQEHFADGMTEDLITDLSGIAGVLVIASNTSFSYKGRQVPPREIRADLNIDYVLEGSVRRHGDALRVNAQLVDAKTAFQVWARRYDRPVQETFAVQDELTNQIAETLAIQLSPQERQRLARQPTNNLAAYDHFREGQRLTKIGTQLTNFEAQAAYRRAIETDLTYGRAYGALAYTMSYSFRRGWSDASMESLDRVLELARHAVELDSSIPQTYWSLGYVHYMRGEMLRAEAAVQKALDIAPNYADGYGLLALIKNGLGDALAAIANIRKGMQLNPYYTWDYPYNLGRAYYTLGQYDEAIVQLEAAKARNPNAIPIRLILAASYMRKGREDDAQWEIEEVQTINPQETLSQFATSFANNHKESLQRLLHDLRLAGLPE